MEIKQKQEGSGHKDEQVVHSTGTGNTGLNKEFPTLPLSKAAWKAP